MGREGGQLFPAGRLVSATPPYLTSELSLRWRFTLIRNIYHLMVNTIGGLDGWLHLVSCCWSSHRPTVPLALSSHTMLSDAQEELKKYPSFFCLSCVRDVWRESY